jgi:trehalose 2-sulfotransferase
MSRSSGYASARYDFPVAVPVRRKYVIASTYRSGSTHLCAMLWATGVMGAPWEYLNFEGDMNSLMARFGATSAGEYAARLLAARTSPNGVFGLKAHFMHFEAALRGSPQFGEYLRDAKFISIVRRDLCAQAVSLAKALQTGAWISLSSARRVPLFYSQEFIAACMEEIRLQTQAWAQWFAVQNVVPLEIEYEALLAEPEWAIDRILQFVGVSRDEGRPVTIMRPERQSDDVNSAWLQRFRHESGRDAGAGDRRWG